jgi:predicted lipoprotein with Yx(FWY)xxD motif
MQTDERTLEVRAESRGGWALVPVLALAALAMLAVVLAQPGNSKASRAKGTLVTTARSTLGRILVDGRGRTLYLFEKDKLGMSACAGTCATYWPPLLTTGKPTAAAGVRATLLGSSKRSDGTMQVTYAGHPLYTFKLDAKAGRAKGEGTDFFGGGWYVVAASGAKLEKPQASSSSNGSGY